MADTFSLELQALWRILLASLVLGAGLPVLFSVGIRAMAWGAGGDAEAHAAGTAGPVGHPAGRVLGIACFAVVLLAVALGITFIVAGGFGKALSFEHVYPTLVDKH
ncbi:hypothetical protein [Kineococcus glutinatus]|uniref:Transmembrane protein n=1 Tax=Kineococcus glutinatus TaxID=1070872 RepID=A0ABP9HFM1_9ACTN